MPYSRRVYARLPARAKMRSEAHPVAGARLIARGEIIQVPLGIQRRHAAGAGGSHGLPVDMVAHVAGGEDARHAGRRGMPSIPLLTLM